MKCSFCGSTELLYVTKTHYEAAYPAKGTDDGIEVGRCESLTLFDSAGNVVETFPRGEGVEPLKLITEDCFRCPRCSAEMPVPADCNL